MGDRGRDEREGKGEREGVQNEDEKGGRGGGGERGRRQKEMRGEEGEEWGGVCRDGEEGKEDVKRSVGE